LELYATHRPSGENIPNRSLIFFAPRNNFGVRSGI
jgi:hypothetical protein